MLFDKQSKQAFMFPPKCGTHTVSAFLRNCGWKLVKEQHFVLDQLVKLYPNLSNYQIYVFVRDPLLRFESAILHVKQKQRDVFANFLSKHGIEKPVEDISYEELIPLFPALSRQFAWIFDPQSKWHQGSNIKALDFRNMEAELRRITGNTEQPLTIYNASTHVGRSVITPVVEEFVRQQYADDYVLWNRFNSAEG